MCPGSAKVGRYNFVPQLEHFGILAVLADQLRDSVECFVPVGPAEYPGTIDIFLDCGVNVSPGVGILVGADNLLDERARNFAIWARENQKEKLHDKDHIDKVCHEMQQHLLSEA